MSAYRNFVFVLLILPGGNALAADPYPVKPVRGIVGPAGMPPEVAAILNKAIQQALASPDLRERYAKDAGAKPQ